MIRLTAALAAFCLGLLPEVSQAQDVSATANSVYRDFNVDGNAASGVYNPPKADIRALWGMQKAINDGVDSNVYNSKTGAYTIAASDCGKTVVFSGGLYTVTLPAVSGFAATCSVVIKNNDSRAKRLAGFPADQPVLLWPQQSLAVKIESGVWQAFYKPGRWRITAGTTLRVNPSTGNDNNDGLAAGAGAFATAQKAWDTLVSYIDMNSFDVNIQLEDGTYTTGLRAGPNPPVGGGQVSVVGNVATPTNVVIAPTVANSVGVQAIGPVFISVAGLYCNSSNLLTCLYTDIGGNIQVSGNMNFGVAGIHMQTSHGMIFVNSSYTISGSATYHLFAAYSGANIEYATNVTGTLTGTPAFTNFARAVNSASIELVSVAGISFTGSATGTRYVASLNGVIDTTGGGANFFPGNAAGVANTGGQYN